MYMCLGKKQPSLAILTQAQQGGCPFGPCVMSAPNASAVSHESVLIAYRWPFAQPASDLPHDLVALCPPETPLELAPRVTGYICSGRVALDDLEEASPSDATAVSFFRMMATAMQTRRFAARAAEPRSCCEGRAMVVWSPLSGISFSELAAAEGQRRGLSAHLLALRATGLLRVLEQCIGKYFEGSPSGHVSKHKRRRLNEDKRELRKAIGQT